MLSPEQIPMALLLEADPSIESVRRYLFDSQCFAALLSDEVIGVCVVNSPSIEPLCADLAEIYNVSVAPSHQQKGIGSALLKFSLEQLKRQGVHRVELGTGTFGYQLAFYQRQGFRVEAVLKDHFLQNYPDPIFENGIQHQDMLRLYVDLDLRALNTVQAVQN